MALSSGTRQLMREVAGWGVAAVIVAAAIIHFDSLKTGTENALGLPAPADVGARQRSAEAAPTNNAPSSNAGQIVELKAARNGHFSTRADVDGRSIDVMVDTGATMVVLTYEDAQRAGITLNDRDFNRAVSTANGIARVAEVTLGRVGIGNILVRDVPAAVAEPGRLGTSLLGMSFLSRLSRFDMRSDALVLQE
jgi:aspartyl protease family protein